MVTTYSVDKTLALTGVTALSNAFIIEFTKDAPAEYISVYLYALMQYQNPAFLNDDIAQALEMSNETVISAFEYWQSKGLLTIVRNEPLHIEFGRANPNSAKYGGGKYASLIDSLRPILGTRILSATELQTVYDWIEVFGLSEDAVKALFIYCIDIKGTRISIRYMDEVAKTWADNGILTEEDARDYIHRNTQYHIGAKEVLKRFGLHRNPTEDEVEIYKKWITEYKLTPDVILEACSSTLSATNPSFAYLSTIIDSYTSGGAVDSESLAEYRKKRDMFDDFCAKIFRNAGLAAKPKAQQKERIAHWLNEYHMPQDLLLMLAEYSAQKAQPFSFMCKCVVRWNELDIHNIADARADLEATKLNAPQTVHKSYIKHNYTESDLAHIGVNFDDED